MISICQCSLLFTHVESQLYRCIKYTRKTNKQKKNTIKNHLFIYNFVYRNYYQISFEIPVLYIFTCIYDNSFSALIMWWCALFVGLFCFYFHVDTSECCVAIFTHELQTMLMSHIRTFVCSSPFLSYLTHVRSVLTSGNARSGAERGASWVERAGGPTCGTHSLWTELPARFSSLVLVHFIPLEHATPSGDL